MCLGGTSTGLPTVGMYIMPGIFCTAWFGTEQITIFLCDTSKVIGLKHAGNFDSVGMW